MHLNNPKDLEYTVRIPKPKDGHPSLNSGQRCIQATVSGVTTAYIGNWFEWTGSTSTMTKYYYAGTQRIALRTGGSANLNLKWLLGDHLGSTSVTADYAGTLLSRTLYKPLHSIQGRLWGEVRYQSGALPTKYTYTGQCQYTPESLPGIRGQTLPHVCTQSLPAVFGRSVPLSPTTIA